MTWIVESIGHWGVKATDASMIRHRWENPRSGDVIDFGENYEENRYPFNKAQYGRIEIVYRKGIRGNGEWLKEGELHICTHPGSAFLSENGSVSISGGPFEVIHVSSLEPTYITKELVFWNWPNGRGAHRGIEYKIARPVFRYKGE